jgi:hypothetical protein
MKRFLNWLADKISPEKASPKVSRYHATSEAGPRGKPVAAKTAKPKNSPDPDVVEFDASVNGRIDSAGPGKNVLRPHKLAGEDADDQEPLSIVGESGAQQNSDDDEGGIDPYNTGKFDRSKNWDKRFRKD